ncbi:hypothetical protein Prudu_018665 [Prunus dulcis]|uniref:Uncharacterized protein n=1 Tax=Prunus dulcis TaxID=3755 RepID=A0A4Y1RRG7_PRUDU|nr:hypothetical protein Prudu_018665 [Prunus dulcis]
MEAPGARQTRWRDLQEVQRARTIMRLTFASRVGDAGTVGARNTDQTDYGPLNPASLRLELTLCHRDLLGKLTDYQELTDYRELTDIRN